MKVCLNLSFLFIFLLVSLSFAQDSTNALENCDRPISSKFDEFEYLSLEEAKDRLELFGLQVKNFSTYGHIIGYGGKRTKSSEGRLIASEIETFLTDKFKFFKYVTLTPRDGGHREVPTVELFIQPERCSTKPEFSPTLSYDEVIYEEEKSFFLTNMLRKPESELKTLIIKEIRPKYPPAARAVRARGKVLVLIIIDEKGNVSNASAVDGHPLLRAVSETALRDAKYQRLKVDNRPAKYGGKVVIDWDQIAEDLETNN